MEHQLNTRTKRRHNCLGLSPYSIRSEVSEREKSFRKTGRAGCAPKANNLQNADRFLHIYRTKGRVVHCRLFQSFAGVPLQAAGTRLSNLFIILYQPVYDFNNATIGSTDIWLAHNILGDMQYGSCSFHSPNAGPAIRYFL